jgi:hypothetical protein
MENPYTQQMAIYRSTSQSPQNGFKLIIRGFVPTKNDNNGDHPPPLRDNRASLQISLSQ